MCAPAVPACVLALLLAIAVAVGAPCAHAEATRPGEQPGVLARLGTPARPDVVAELVGTLDPTDTDAAVRLAHALGHAGGCGALPGIVRLLDHRALEVRLAAMEAAGRAGLRAETLAARLRRTVLEGSPAERLAAVEALGRVGDGRDASTLLDLTEGEGTRLRVTAFRALEDLTGAKLPFVRARWVWYWKGFGERSARLLPEVSLALEAAIDGPDRRALADLVRRYGWVDVSELTSTLRQWLVSPDHELRVLTCELVGGLRLADLAPDVRECLRFAGSSEHREAARRALDALGYRMREEAVSTRGD